jgi:putative addiction module component (TIGR02574 family)
MNARTRHLLDELLVLPAEDRALIAAELEASLEEEPASAEELERAWAVEIEKRARDVEEGRATPIAAEDVHRELRAGLRTPR